MTPDELLDRLDVLDMNHSELGQLCGRDPATVYRWVRGIRPVPTYVETILKLKLEAHLTECKLATLPAFTRFTNRAQ